MIYSLVPSVKGFIAVIMLVSFLTKHHSACFYLKEGSRSSSRNLAVLAVPISESSSLATWLVLFLVGLGLSKKLNSSGPVRHPVVCTIQ